MEIREVDHAEADAFRHALATTFGLDPDLDPGGANRWRALVPRGRAWCATDDGEMVATAAAFPLGLQVPGGAVVPMAGLTQVTVRPTHRRRGILRQLMARYLDDARAHGEPLSGLWASEGTIYGRFGFGAAAFAEAISFDARHAGFAMPAALGEPDEPVMIDEAAARERLPPIYARATAGRPGVFVRSPDWWRERRFLEAPQFRGGATKIRYIVARRDGRDVGYLTYRQKSSANVFDLTTASSTLIGELIALDARAEASLWRYTTGVDLYPAVSWSYAPIDCPLPWLLADRRRATRKPIDTLWLRPNDVPAALAARRYERDGALRFSSDGRMWALEIAGGRAQVEPTTRDAELALEPDALGAAYLGGVSFSTLARAGRVVGAAEAIARADALFAWSVVPWCGEMF